MAKWIKRPVYHGDDTSGFVDPNWTCSYCGEKAPIIPYWGIYDLVPNCPHCMMIMKFEEGRIKMADCMVFPDTLDDFLKQYQFKDNEEIYTNGSMLIPVFRVKQWAEHAAASMQKNVRGEWLPVDELNDAFDCSECDAMVIKQYNFCPVCGAQMKDKIE